MSSYKKIFLVALSALMSTSFLYALTPNLTITPSSDNIKATITVSQGDPNAIVQLYYTSGLTNATQYQTLGLTDASGAFSTTIGQYTYNISPANQVYVLVNQIPSAAVTWPLNSVIDVNSLSLSNTNPTIVRGQSGQTKISGGIGSYTITETTNPNVALPNLTGDTLNYSGNAVGTSTVKICSTTTVCTTQSIYVINATNTIGNPISYSFPLSIGQTLTLPLYGGDGPYYIPTPVSTPFDAQISGTNLRVTGKVFGGNSVTVCGGPTNCSQLSFIVYPSSTTFSQTTTARQATQSTSQTESVGQSTSRYVFKTALKPGMKGREVLELQKRLQLEGYLDSTPNGYYGVGTTAAVRSYQQDHGLAPLGTVGPGTRDILNNN